MDGDPKVLEIARRKAEQAGLALRFDHGSASQLPYPDQSFERVVSSLVMHHLETDDKRRAFAEVFRVLKPGGELHLADFGPPHGVYARALSGVVRHLERAEDNIAGSLPKMMREAGLRPVEGTGHLGTVLGTLILWRAEKP